jgi:Protein of unknown function (DUF2950)
MRQEGERLCGRWKNGRWIRVRRLSRRVRKLGGDDVYINQDGVLLQKDLGTATTQTVTTMNAFDPDPGWSIVEP